MDIQGNNVSTAGVALRNEAHQQASYDNTRSTVSTKEVEEQSNPAFLHDSTTHHHDALLLAAFAEIATKTANPTVLSRNEKPNQQGQTGTSSLSTLSPRQPSNAQYNNIRPRPRAVSDTSTYDTKTLVNTTHLATSPRKKPLEIQPQRATTPTFYRTILKKKFSWKKYPPLEKFLLANRDEYIRHSTLNYTLQQKQYNNNLTKQMIELAAQCGLIFDDNDFSFVTIRDRIRCYYKSYVQSLKKRGVLLGYAARKAGLVSDNDIELSASTAGKIYVPTLQF